MQLAVALWWMCEESVALQCELMRCMCMYIDSLDAVKPVAMESVMVPSGGRCAYSTHGCGAEEAVKRRAVRVVFC